MRKKWLALAVVAIMLISSTAFAGDSKKGAKLVVEKCSAGFGMAIGCFMLYELLSCVAFPWTNCAEYIEKKCLEDNEAEIARWRLLWAQGVEGAPYLQEC